MARGKALVAKLRADPKVVDAEALAAWIGRHKKLRRAGVSSKQASKLAGQEGGLKKGGVKGASGGKKGGGSSSKPKRITAKEVDEKPWEYSPNQYQAAKGVEQPHIGEISPMQYSKMGRQSKDRDKKKRREEWQASADIKQEWQEKVEKAYRDEKISRDDPSLSKDARAAIIRSDIRRKEREKQVKLDAALEKNNIDSVDDFKVGDKLHSPLYGYGKVLKKNKKTVKMTLLDSKGNVRKNRDGSDMVASVPVKFLERKKSTEVTA